MPKLKLIPPLPDQKSPEDLLDGHDVAKMLNVTISWVRNHCTRNKPLLPHVKFGSGQRAATRFKREDILKFIDEHMVHSRR
jgi:Helix-turn-helix domain